MRERPVARVRPELDARVAWVARAVALGFLVAAGVTRHLWLTSGRLYPLFPVTDLLPQIAPPWDAVAFAALLAANAAVLVRPTRRTVLTAAGAYLVYSLWDEQRWVPFFNEMGGLYVAIALTSGRDTDDANDDALATCGVVVACIYLWSGIQKFNPHYVDDTFAWMLSPFAASLPGLVMAHTRPLAVVTASTEVAIAVMLLFPATRRIAVVVGTLMHLFIFLSAGPFGNNGNAQIWSWNFVAIALLFLIFWRSSWSPGRLLTVRRSPMHTAALVYWGLLPILNFVVLRKWDDFQAATLYSGNESQATIYVPPDAVPLLPSRLRDLVWQGDDSRVFILVRDWAYADLEVPDYHAERIYENDLRAFCRYVKYAPGFVMEAGSKADPFTGARRITRYTCDRSAGIARLAAAP